MLVGTFTDETETKVKIALRLLVQILQKGDVKSEVIFDGEQLTVSIIGSLPSQERVKAELILNHLKKLLDYEMSFWTNSEFFKEVADLKTEPPFNQSVVVRFPKTEVEYC